MSLFVLYTFSRIEEFGSSQRDVGRDLDCCAGRVVLRPYQRVDDIFRKIIVPIISLLRRMQLLEGNNNYCARSSR